MLSFGKLFRFSYRNIACSRKQYSSTSASPAIDKIHTTKSNLKQIKRQARLNREWNIWGYATAKSYPLKNLKRFVNSENCYDIKTFGPVEIQDSVCLFRIKANETLTTDKCKDFFVFEEGAIVFWDCEPDERWKVINTFARFADSPLKNETIEEGKEKVFYILDETLETTHFKRKPYEDLYLKSLQDDEESLLDRYTVSHAIVASVKVSNMH